MTLVADLVLVPSDRLVEGSALIKQMPSEPQTSSARELQMLQVGSELIDVRSSWHTNAFLLYLEPEPPGSSL